jgi:hypothetical protein
MRDMRWRTWRVVGGLTYRRTTAEYRTDMSSIEHEKNYIRDRGQLDMGSGVEVGQGLGALKILEMEMEIAEKKFPMRFDIDDTIPLHHIHLQFISSQLYFLDLN